MSFGYDTAYLWEEVFQPDTWLRVLGSFVEIERERVVDEKGKTTIKEKILFPRYHQLDAVTRLVEVAREEGAGHRYLLQHSAGSGKSNTIGWLAHQLSTLHTHEDEKVFDSVIVITDRTVLDEQLRDTIKQFQSNPGVVVSVYAQEGAKSASLASALKKGAMIIVVTLQTFPFVIKEIHESKALLGRKFAVIIDEAHSSQSGATSRQLRAVLGFTPDDDDQETMEDLLARESTLRRFPPNASFIALTATPKTKTLEVFGRRDDPDSPASPENPPKPFHLYTMRQAIDEEFILDVLKNFLPYRVAYKLAHNGKDWDDKVVEKAEGLKQLAKWVQLHPHNIAQKVEVIVEHFRHSVARMLEGKARGDGGDTASRQEAVRYKLAIDKYIRDCGYLNLATLVAFSGDVVDSDFGPDKFNEGNMNPGLKGRSIRNAFKAAEYQVLIVANKFQTGFDQPLLCAMYVDKRLDGISAVQDAI